MTTIHAYDLQPGDIVDYHGKPHHVTHVARNRDGRGQSRSTTPAGRWRWATTSCSSTAQPPDRCGVSRATRTRPDFPTATIRRPRSIGRDVDVPDPVVRSGGVVIAVEAVGVQGGDLLHRAGGVMPSSPHVVGYQAAGRVGQVGSDVAGFEVGQPVVATMAAGSHAELVSVPAGSVYAIPEGVSIDEAAGVPIEFGTADDCLFEFRPAAEG